jgi:DNA-binding NtrC family response regulator
VNQQNILIVDDEPDIRNLVQEILVDEGYEVRVAENTDDARQHASKLQPDLVLLDIWMPGEDGISLLKDWQSSGGISCPVVMMSGHGTVETAVEATRLGAYDFIEKPLTMAKLLVSVKRALEAADGDQDKSNQGKLVEEPVGSSMQMRALRDQAKKLAQHENNLFILGESGVGKKLFANYVHSLCANRKKRFLTLSEEYFNDSDAIKQLFGSEENGVITPGLLELSKGGTIFISDVFDLNEKGQKLLLRLLQRKKFSRIGGNTLQNLESRIMVASQHSLQEEVKANHFNDELYFQINVVSIRLPALRDRLQDVPELLRHYIDFYCAQENYPYRSFSIAAQNRLLHYTWPGNILELRNLVQRLLILSTSDEINTEEVENALNDDTAKLKTETTSHEKLYELPLREARELFERSYLLHQLKEVNGNISKLSERVGMERTHLYRKLRALGISAKES